MADNGVPQLDETQCGGGTHADSTTVKNDVHGNMASEVCGTLSDGKANSLGSYLLEYQSQECQRHVRRIDELLVIVLYQLLLRYGITN